MTATAPTSSTTAEPVETATNGRWTSVAESPLPGRYASVAAWTGTEVIVFSGANTEFHYYPALDPGRFLRDGAAYNPATDTWRKIAPAPFGHLHFSEHGVRAFTVAGRNLYVMTPWPSPSSDLQYFAYSLDDDTWSRLPAPPAPKGRGNPAIYLVPAGDGVFAWGPTQKNGRPPDMFYDPAARAWSRVAPHRQSGGGFTRFVVALLDGRVVSITFSHGGAKRDVRAPRYSAAVYDPAAGAWSPLPDAPFVAAGLPRWELAGGRVLNLDPTSKGSGNVGGQLDPSTGEWTPLPPLPNLKQPKSLSFASGSGGNLAVRQGWALDVTSQRWLRLPPLPGAAPRLVEPAAVVWAGDRLFAWGGLLPGGTRDEKYAARGWTWRP